MNGLNVTIPLPKLNRFIRLPTNLAQINRQLVEWQTLSDLGLHSLLSLSVRILRINIVNHTEAQVFLGLRFPHLTPLFA